MTTTGRRESMNTYFDGYVQSNTMLNEFVVQYDKITHARLEAKEKEDFQTSIRGWWGSVISKVSNRVCASNNYTHET